MGKIQVLRFSQSGNPIDVIRFEEEDLPELTENQVRVRVLFASISPADINVLEGTYGRLPSLPAIPGNEGVGVVEEGCLPEGTLVLLDRETWRSHGNWDVSRVIPMGSGAGKENIRQLAMLRINPPTAWGMLKNFVSLKEGDWVIQNAGNSGVGYWLRTLAEAWNLRVISLMRHPIDTPLLAHEHRIIEDGDALEKIKTLVGKEPVSLACNAVGGESASLLMKILTHGGTLLTYGAMSRRPLRVSNGHLIFKDLRLRGFWVTQWLQEISPEERALLYKQLASFVFSKKVEIPIERVFPLEQAKEALARAMASGRSGKILFEMQKP